MNASDPARPIFIVGFPRSGTTLVHGLVGAHPRIAAPPEMHFFSRVQRHRAYWGSLADDGAVRRVVHAIVDSKRLAESGFDVEVLTARALAGQRSLSAIFRVVMDDFADRQGKTRWCEKTPMQSASLIWGHYPDAQVIHVIRDPRESVASSLQRMDATRAAGVAQAWRAFTMRNVRDGAQRGAGNYLRVRYEDLVRGPEQVMTIVFTFLHEVFDPAVLLDPGLRRSVLSPVVIPWQQNVLGPITVPAADAWRTRMTWQQRVSACAVLEPVLAPLGYPVTDRRTVLQGRLVNAAHAPADWAQRRRVARARRRLRTPEQRYDVGMRNWRYVHDGAVAGRTDEEVHDGTSYGWFGIWSA